MPRLWESLSATPAENGLTAAPVGAPEGGVSDGDISDIFRWQKAAIRELGDWITSILATFGGMQAQSPGAVAITGGTIAGTTLGSTNTIDAEALKSGTLDVARLPTGTSNIDALKLGGRTRQQLYDDVWPVGSERGWNSTDLSGLTPTGLTATWAIVGQDCLLAGAGSTYAAGSTTGSGTDATTTAAGAVAAGSTGSTALLLAGLPVAEYLVDVVATGAPATNAASTPKTFGYGKNIDAGSGLGIQTSYVTGGGAGHTHTVPAIAAHSHPVALPKRYAAVWVRRTA